MRAAGGISVVSAASSSAALSVCAAAQTFLAFDLGTRKTGVAYASRLLAEPRPLPTLHASGDQLWLRIEHCIKEWQPDALVVGVPFHPDGAAHAHTRRAERFVRQLQGRYALPVYGVDERYSTTEALSRGAADADAGAACVILEQFLRSLN